MPCRPPWRCETRRPVLAKRGSDQTKCPRSSPRSAEFDEARGDRNGPDAACRVRQEQVRCRGARAVLLASTHNPWYCSRPVAASSRSGTAGIGALVTSGLLLRVKSHTDSRTTLNWAIGDWIYTVYPGQAVVRGPSALGRSTGGCWPTPSRPLPVAGRSSKTLPASDREEEEEERRRERLLQMEIRETVHEAFPARARGRDIGQSIVFLPAAVASSLCSSTSPAPACSVLCLCQFEPGAGRVDTHPLGPDLIVTQVCGC